jgi:hypothetical protein
VVEEDDQRKLDADGSSHLNPADTEERGEDSPPDSPCGPSQAPMLSFLNIAKLGSANAAAPEPSSAAKSRLNRISVEPDLISKGVISLTTAQRLLDRYFSRLDHYIWAAGYQYTGLENLRRSSPMLLTAICTVSALHEIGDGSLYDVCSHEFRQLLSRALFEKRDIEYIRGLCVGLYWFSDIARIVSSDAIRRAVDIRLHTYLHQLPDPGAEIAEGDAEHGEEANIMNRTRLWYMLYIGDQHLSVLYNRDPIMREEGVIPNHEAFLESPQATDADARMISQVALLIILSQIRETFGADTGDELPKSLGIQFNIYNRQIERWYAHYSPALSEFTSMRSPP